MKKSKLVVYNHNSNQIEGFAYDSINSSIIIYTEVEGGKMKQFDPANQTIKKIEKGEK